MAFIFANNTLRKLFGGALSEFQDIEASVATLPIDITLSEQHSLPVMLTSKPVEDGDTITDNIVLSGASVSITGIMTDSLLESLFGSAGSWEDKFKILEEIRRARIPFTIVTSVKTYSNVFFSSAITIDREASKHGALFFSTTVTEIITIESKVTAVPAIDSGKTDATAKSNAPGTDGGKKQLRSGSSSLLIKAGNLLGFGG